MTVRELLLKMSLDSSVNQRETGSRRMGVIGVALSEIAKYVPDGDVLVFDASPDAIKRFGVINREFVTLVPRALQGAMEVEAWIEEDV